MGKRHRVIMPIGGVHRGTLAALGYARMLSHDVTAVHVAMDDSEAEKVKQKWEVWGGGTRLVIVPSPYRLMLEPLIRYIEQIGGCKTTRGSLDRGRAAVCTAEAVEQSASTCRRPPSSASRSCLGAAS